MNERDKTQGKKRSPKWAALRRKLLKGVRCAVCGGKDKLELHHILPFSIRPDLELDPKNLIPLCENKRDGVNCHLLVGHLGCFRSYNRNVTRDAISWARKIKTRP